jgi:transketolase
MTSQRDIFINELYKVALTNSEIIMISADMGAPSLDQWRENLPDQFIAAGISEQNAINIAAGLASQGKKVYVYFMASWTCRCLEQIRYSCAMANLPITILANGVALGYAPSGPAHEPNEDIALVRSLNNIEIYSPSNEKATKNLVSLSLAIPFLRYIRLERTYAKQVADVDYGDYEYIKIIKSSQADDTKRLLVASSGYMLGRCLDAFEVISKNTSVSVVDISKIKPLDEQPLIDLLSTYTHLLTVEEQTLSGNFSSALCEFISDNNINISIKRMGLPNYYIFDNGDRDYLLDKHGLSVDSIVRNSNILINC